MPAPPPETGAWTGWRDFRVASRRFEDAGQTQCSFRLTPSDGEALPPFLPGQYLTFELPAGPGGRLLTRCYSISEPPDPDGYRVTVKRAGAVSNHWHDAVQPGAVLRLRAPAGRFVIDAEPAVPAVFIAGGIGITPLLSMLLWSLEAQPGRVLHLFYAVREEAALAFAPELERLAALHPHFHLHILSNTEAPGREPGLVDAARLAPLLPPAGRHIFYLCGPAGMMAAMETLLAKAGVAPADIRQEAFGPAALAPQSSPQSFTIRFETSGRSIAWDGQDACLLDFAERHGVAVESGCRTGSCGSCETAVLAGTTAHRAVPDHPPGPGHCLLCLAVPESDLVLAA
jgi:ferredoxin-NADP reductase